MYKAAIKLEQATLSCVSKKNFELKQQTRGLPIVTQKVWTSETSEGNTMSQGSPASCVSRCRKMASLGPSYPSSPVFIGSVESFRGIGLENELVRMRVPGH